MAAFKLQGILLSYLWCSALQVSMAFNLQHSTEKQTREFCQDEHVQITCTKPNHVIMVLQAKYGRMKIGKCVIGDYGGTGCMMDALFHLDHLCTGSTECKFRVFDATPLREQNACPGDVASYIEVSYVCVRVLETEPNECLVHKRITTRATTTTTTTATATTATTSTTTSTSNNDNNDDIENHAYLSSMQTLKQNFASPSCPWLISTTRGQRIALYLRYVSPEYNKKLDTHRKENTNYHHHVGGISGGSGSGGSGISSGGGGGGGGNHNKYRPGNANSNINRYKNEFQQTCYDLLFLEDRDVIPSNRHKLSDLIGSNQMQSQQHIPISETVTKISTCDSIGGQESEIFKSKHSNVVVTTVAKQQLEGLGRFFLRFKVSGCSDVIAPFNSSTQRKGDRTIVKCNHSDMTWELLCRNNTWVGDTNYNCNQGVHSAWGITNIFDRHFPFGILIVVSSGVALGIFLGGLLLVCVVVYMRRVQNHDVNEKFITTYNDEQLRDSYAVTMTTPDVLDPAYNETNNATAASSYGDVVASTATTFDQTSCKMHGQPYVDVYNQCQIPCQLATSNNKNNNIISNNNNSNNNNYNNNSNIVCHGNQISCQQAVSYLANTNKIGGGHLYELPRPI